MIKILTRIILILGCAFLSFAQLEPKGALASIPVAESRDGDDEDRDEGAQQDESPQTDYKFPSPRKPGKRVGGVISNWKAEENLEDSQDVRWDTNSRNPYAYYTITIRNNGAQTLECLLRAMIYIDSRETDKRVESNWNIDEKKFKLKPGEIKTIKGKIEWYGDKNLYPGFEHEILAMFSK